MSTPSKEAIAAETWEKIAGLSVRYRTLAEQSKEGIAIIQSAIEESWKATEGEERYYVPPAADAPANLKKCKHEFVACVGPSGNTTTGALICKFCGELTNKKGGD